MPGSLTSMPYSAVPLTLSGVSSRLAGVPISLKSFGSLSATCRGRHRQRRRPLRELAVAELAAGRVVDDYAVLRARQEAASTPQVCAAASTRSMRAAAPAWRSGFQKARTEVEPPVTWTPRRGLA